MEEREKSFRQILEENPELMIELQDAGNFYINILLNGIRLTAIEDVDDVFDNLNKCRQEHNMRVNIASLSLVTLVATSNAINQFRVGRTPEDFLETISAFHLIREAINDERLFSEPEIDVAGGEMLREHIARASKLIIEPYLTRLQTRHH